MSDAVKATHGPTLFEGATPILRVENLPASIAYYVKTLGFKLNWEDPDIMAGVSRDRCHLMLCAGDQGHEGGWVWVGVEDADRLFEEYCATRATIRHPPTNYRWAYEMQVTDPDGNVLRCGSEPKAGQPIGEWLDMHGERWVKSDGSGWTKVTNG